MLRILDRYVIRQIIPPYALALLILTFMLMMGPIDRVAQELLAKGVALPTIARMLFLLIPQALAVTIPMAFLLGMLVAFGRLSGDSEWVAMQACGVTLGRVLRPVLALAVLSWAATQFVLIEAVPWCNQSYREIEYGVVAARVENEIRPRMFFGDYPGLILYARDVPAGGQGWRDVFVADTTASGPPLAFVARSGRLQLDRVRRKIAMVLEDLVSYKVTPGESGQWKYEANPARSLLRNLDPETVFPRSGPQKGEAEMTVAELQEMIATLRAQGLPPERPEYKLHEKFSIPMACLVFALMGLGLGIGTSRGGNLAAFALGTGVIFAYYVVMFEARSLAITSVIPGWFGAWLPNIVLGPAGAMVVVRRARSSGRSWQFGLPAALFRRLLRRAAPELDAPASPSSRTVLVIRLPRLGLPRPRTLDRYMARTYLRIQGLTFVSLLGIFYISKFIDLSHNLFKGQTTAGAMLRYFFYQTPQFVYYVLPLSVLVATLVTIGALTRNSELIVMKACGISLYRIAVPLLLLGAATSVVLFGLEERVLAYSNRRAVELEYLIRQGKPRPTGLLTRQWVAGRNGDIYHYLFFSPREKELREFSKYEFDQQSWRLTRLTFMTAARFEPSSERPGGQTGTWKSAGGWVFDVNDQGAPRAFTTFTGREFALEPPEYFGTEQAEPASMTYGELNAYIGRMRGAGLNLAQYLVDLHRKLAFPAVTIVMTLLAVPFAVTTGRRGALYGIGIGIMLAMVYWTANNLFGLVGVAGLMSPALAAWAPNMLFGSVAAFLLLTVRT